jgi:hypothetical protein
LGLDATSLELQIRQLLGGPRFPDAGPFHILVLLILTSYGQNGTNMRPNGDTLVYETAMSRRSVGRVLKDLEMWGLLHATKRNGRKPVIWEIGEALKEMPQEDHTRALDAKARVLLERDKDEKTEPNPHKQFARAVKGFQKRCPSNFRARNDEARAEIVVLPDSTLRIADEILHDLRPEWPTETPTLLTQIVEKTRYASFAAAHTREDTEGQ